MWRESGGRRITDLDLGSSTPTTDGSPYRFYYQCSMCPACGAPYTFDAPACLGENGVAICGNPRCRAHYLDALDLSEDRWSALRAGAIRSNPDLVKDRLLLPREAALNPLERDIADFITGVPNGRFLVTWPPEWGRPRFLTLAVLMTALMNRGKRISFIYRSEKGGRLDAFASLHTVRVAVKPPHDDPDPGKSLRKNLKKNIEQAVLKQRPLVEITTFARGVREGRQERIAFDHSDKRCPDALKERIDELVKVDPALKEEREHLKKEATDAYRRASKGSPESYKDVINFESKDAIYNVRFEVRPEREKLGKYNVNRLIEFVLTPTEEATSLVHVCRVGDSSFKMEGLDVLFVPEDLEGDPLLTAAEFRPDLLIIEDSDRWVRDGYSKGMGDANALHGLLRGDRIPSIFLVSIDPDSRWRYDLGTKRGMGQHLTSVITLDNKEVLKAFSPKEPLNNEDVRSPLSSAFGNHVQRERKVIFEKRPVARLDGLQDLIAIIGSLDIPGGVAEKLESFLLFLVNRPLGLADLRDDLFDLLSAEIKEPIRNSIMIALKQVFGENLSEEPLMDELIKVIVEKSGSPVIVVSEAECDDILRKIHERLPETKALLINTSTWNSLAPRCGRLLERKGATIVALYPDHFGNLEPGEGDPIKVLALGSNLMISLIEDTVMGRYSDISRHPLWAPPEGALLPAQYRKAVEGMGLDAEKIEHLNRATRCRRSSSRWGAEKEAETADTIFIYKGQSALKIVDRDGNAILLPTDKRPVTILSENGWLDRLNLTEKRKEELVGKSILLNDAQVRLEFKKVFYETCFKHDEQATIFYRALTWSSYRALYENARVWRDDILRAVEHLREGGMSQRDAQNEIVTMIHELPIKARNQDSIRSWLDEPVYSDGCRVYRHDRTWSDQDIETIYAALNQRYPSLGLDQGDGIKSWFAASFLQECYNDALKGIFSETSATLADECHERFGSIRKDLIIASSVEEGFVRRDIKAYTKNNALFYDSIFQMRD